MEGWFSDNGRPTILDALSEVFGRLEDDYRDVVKVEYGKKAELKAELELQKTKVANADRLEQQNKALKDELAQLKAAKRTTAQSQARQTQNRESREALTPISANVKVSALQRSIKYDPSDIEGLSHLDLVIEYRRLEGKYEKLRGDHIHSLHVNEKLQKQYRDSQKAYKDWEKYAGDLITQLENRKKKIQKLKGQAGAASHNAGPSLASETHSPVGEDTREVDQPPRGAPDSERGPSLPRVSRTADERPIKEENSSDVEELSSDDPVIVSERSVRKRKHDGQQTETPAVTRIKTELSSDPVVTDEQYRFKPHESIDFDDAADPVPTPRKNRTSRPKFDTARQPPISEHPDQSETGGGEMTLDCGLPPSRSSALQPLGTNISVQRSLARKPKSKAVAPSSLRQGIDNLAEDGDQSDHSRSSLHQPNRTGRLNNLLDNASPTGMTMDLTVDDETEDGPISPVFRMPQIRALPFGSYAQVNSKSKVGNALRRSETPVVSNSKRSSTTIQPKPPDPTGKKTSKNEGVLRERPTSALKIGDFKPNPKYNNADDFAYVEVVRNKDQRAGLQGLVTEEFRDMARGARELTGIFEYTNLLEEYLGDDCARLSYMSPTEKERLWVEAKAQELATRHGKQRAKYHRRPTPPGMWTTDFPNTQEQIKDREEAAEMEMKIIEDRRREAMRPNGHWLFRDE